MLGSRGGDCSLEKKSNRESVASLYIILFCRLMFLKGGFDDFTHENNTMFQVFIIICYQPISTLHMVSIILFGTRRSPLRSVSSLDV